MQRQYRMRKNGQFQYVFRKGKGMGCREMSLTYVRAGRMQVGFSVSKKVGNAVTRNRVKRRIMVSMCLPPVRPRQTPPTGSWSGP